MNHHFNNLLWKLLRHSSTSGDIGCLRKLLTPQTLVNQDTVNALLDEIKMSVELRESLDTPGARLWKESSLTHADQTNPKTLLAVDGSRKGRILFLYVATRMLRPKVVIETGCFTGWDSAMILQALHKNREGHLYTIDIPAKEGQFSQIGPDQGLPPGLLPGFLVPQSFRSRWSLILGNVRDELPSLLQKLKKVDLFFHDSDHTYTHMMWEYSTVWPYLSEGGLLVSDDISWNTAFWDFANGVSRQFVIHRNNPNVGASSHP